MVKKRNSSKVLVEDAFLSPTQQVYLKEEEEDIIY